MNYPMKMRQMKTSSKILHFIVCPEGSGLAHKIELQSEENYDNSRVYLQYLLH